MMYNGVAHRYYAREIAPPMGGFRMLGSVLGQTSNCFDANGLSISCLDPNCAGGPCGGQVQSPPAPVAGAPTGSILLYQGSWQITLHQVDPSKNLVTDASQILAIVSQNLPGLQILGQPQTDFSNVSAYIGLSQSLQVTLNLQVTGYGFASPGDAKSIVDHAYYIATGTMPVSSSISVVSTPSAGGAPGGYNLPPGAAPPPAAVPSTWLSSLFSSTGAAASSAASQSLTSWFEQNGMLMFGILVAAIALPQLISSRR